MRKTESQKIALCGVLGALSVVLLLVGGIVRQNGAPVIPSGADALQEGDDVVIVTTDTTLHALRDIVK